MNLTSQQIWVLSRLVQFSAYSDPGPNFTTVGRELCALGLAKEETEFSRPVFSITIKGTYAWEALRGR